jgi:hypothetical protein
VGAARNRALPLPSVTAPLTSNLPDKLKEEGV